MAVDAIATDASAAETSGKEALYRSTRNFYTQSASQYADQWNNPKIMSCQRQRIMGLRPAPANLLDVGCGTGRDAQLFEAAGYRVIGIDLSEEMLAEAASRSTGTAKFLRCNMMDMPFRDNFYDIAWMSASLLHLTHEDADQALVEVRRVLADNGLMYVTVKEGDNNEAVDTNGRFYSYWNAETFDQTIEQAGFRIVESWNSTTGPVEWLNVIAEPA